MAEPAIDAKQAAPILGVHWKTLLRMAADGRVPAFHIGGRWKFTESSLVTWRDGQLQSVPARQRAPLHSGGIQ